MKLHDPKGQFGMAASVNHRLQKKKALRSRLSAYSATAIAALAAAPAVHAEITNFTGFILDGEMTTIVGFKPGVTPRATSFTANFGTNGHLKIGLFGYAMKSTSHRVTNARVSFAIANSGFVAVTNSRYSNALNLAPGDPVNGQNFALANGMLARNHGAVQSGQFLPPGSSASKTGYVGIRFALSGVTNYGWLRMRVNNSSSGFPSQIYMLPKAGSISIFGAFDSKADIAADGFKVGSVAAVPEPSLEALTGLGLLAVGAAGLREMRRRKAAA